MGRANSIVWFRRDLRLADNPALARAVETGGCVIPVFIWSPEDEAPWSPGGASKWWLHHSLVALAAALQARGARLILRRGQPLAVLKELANQTGAATVFWNRLYEPAIRTRDDSIQAALTQGGIQAESFNAALLHEPWAIQNKSGRPFQVFTPFWRHCLDLPDPPEPILAPSRIALPQGRIESLDPGELGLLPKPDWAGGISKAWSPGSRAAEVQLASFIRAGLDNYAEGREIPADPGTSRLSPHLHFGEISPRQIWSALRSAGTQPGQGVANPKERSTTGSGAKAAGEAWRQSRFAAELGWREFSHHLIHHFPQMDREPIRAEFKGFRWRQSPEWLRAWQQGRTGYPLVDAGMRELWNTGWMHNRVRMVAASFLVKHLLVPWHDGAKWFWDTLVDADLAQNSMGWQWVAGCGADAAPFFRIFNPILQGVKFDPSGAYVRRWVPELGGLPAAWIHTPWKASAEVLARAGVEIGKTYPEPIVSHSIAREVALEAYSRMRQS